MQGETRERWQRLCEQAAIEQNPARLMDLVNEINRLLDEKQERLNNLLPIQKAHPKLLDLADRTMAETSKTHRPGIWLDAVFVTMVAVSVLGSAYALLKK
ncbi:MAG: hypothetical protein DMG93_03405 [Acidobacteria bacterium]|nr:MAG: hypothetical protein DMG93_03405 [Acidobacteriota bacterium]